MMEDEIPDSISSEVQIRKGSIPKNNWQWIVLGFSALNVVFLGGKRRAFGTFVAELHGGIFNTTSLTELNLICDSYAALGYLTVGFSTWFILWIGRKYRISQFFGGLLILIACISSAYVNSVHWLFLTHTVLHGIGSSLVLATVGLIVGEYFPVDHKYHVLATTLVSGGSLASVMFVEMYAVLIDYCGWRNALIILGFMYCLLIWAGAIVFSTRPTISSSSLSATKRVNVTIFCRTVRQIGRNRIILICLWLLDRIITSIVTYGMLLNLIDYLKRNASKDSDVTSYTSLTALFAAGEALTYLLGALLGAVTRDLFANRLRYVLFASSVAMATCLMLWEALVSYQLSSGNGSSSGGGKINSSIINSNINSNININSISNSNEYSVTATNIQMILAFFAGLFLGPSITFLFPAGEEMTQLTGEIAYPISLAGMGLGMLLSPLLSAMVAQHFHYRWFFLVQGCLMLLKSLCLFFGILLIWRDWSIIISSGGVGAGGVSLLQNRRMLPGERNRDDRELLLDSDQFTMLKRDDSSFLPLPETQLFEEEEDEEYEDELDDHDGFNRGNNNNNNNNMNSSSNKGGRNAVWSNNNSNNNNSNRMDHGGRQRERNINVDYIGNCQGGGSGGGGGWDRIDLNDDNDNYVDGAVGKDNRTGHNGVTIQLQTRI